MAPVRQAVAVNNGYPQHGTGSQPLKRSQFNDKLRTGDSFKVFSQGANAWVETEVVKREADSVCVQWTEGQTLCRKNLRLHATRQMTVLSLNMEFNTRLFDEPGECSNLYLLGRCIRDTDPDVIALQEAVHYPNAARDPVMSALQDCGYKEIVSTTFGESLDGRVEKAISFEGMIYGKAEPNPLIGAIRDTRKPTYSKNILQDDDHPLVNKLYVKEGICVKSSGSVLVSPTGLVTYWPEKDAKREPVPLAPRFLAYVELEFEGKSVYVLSTHYVGGRFEDTDFIAATEYRRKQSEAISKWAKGKSVVLVGDFNASQDYSLNNAPFLLKYANSLPLFAQEKADLKRFIRKSGMAADNEDATIEQWVISKYDKYMTQPMDSLLESGWKAVEKLVWSSMSSFASKATKSRPAFTFKFNTVVDHVFWRGAVNVRSAEVLWTLAFGVNPAGEAKFGEADQDPQNGFTDHNAVLVTVDLE